MPKSWSSEKRRAPRKIDADSRLLVRAASYLGMNLVLRDLSQSISLMLLSADLPTTEIQRLLKSKHAVLSWMRSCSLLKADILSQLDVSLVRQFSKDPRSPSSMESWSNFLETVKAYRSTIRRTAFGIHRSSRLSNKTSGGFGIQSTE